MDERKRDFLTRLFNAAVAAADPGRAMQAFLPKMPRGRLVVVGAGKGAAQMARAFEQLWPEPVEGIIVTRYGFGVECERIRVLEAAHPVPDLAGEAAARALMQLVSGLNADDLVVALISGGGSSLLPAPAFGLTLEDEQVLNQVLLKSGAPISAMNAIRKQVSAIKGGRLAALAHPARVVTLVVSDVPGDQASEVASGPTVPGDSTARDALSAIRAYRIPVPDHLLDVIRRNEMPRPDDPTFARDETHVIASARQSLEAAAALCRAEGFEARILSDALEGEARDIGAEHAELVRRIIREERPLAQPVVLLSGGETTVTLDRPGRGGRNTEYLLSFCLGIEDVDGVYALAADTDGIDGSEDNAGAFADTDTARSIRLRGGNPAELLDGHDAWHAFKLAGTLFSPGPTGTNVNDFRAILIT